MSSEQLKNLIVKHCETIGEMYCEFQSLYLNRETGAAPGAEAMGVLHKLKGSSGSIGFSKVNVAVTAFEQQLKDWPADPASGPSYETSLSSALTTLRELVEGTTPEDSTLYGMKL